MEYIPIEELKIDMIKAFPLDYMHLICLGVMKRLLTIWIKGNAVYKENKFTSRISNAISLLLEDCGKTIPKEYYRAIRGLKYISFWKATEFRTFLLKTGPVVLKNYLPTV